MDEQTCVLDRLITLITTKFSFDMEVVNEHLLEPLNGDYFKFDSINMVFFIVELMKEFHIKIDDLILAVCSNWTISDFEQYLKELCHSQEQ